MSKNTKTIVGLVLLIAVLLVAVGYAVITNRTLNITGDAKATTNSQNFTVRFTGTPEVSDASKVTAKISEQDELAATINVSGLTAKGDEATATYTIENTSKDLSAELTANVSKNTNTEYFDVKYNIAEPSTLEHGATTTITVTVTLIKTPIDTDPTSDIGITITANPQQPSTGA